MVRDKAYAQNNHVTNSETKYPLVLFSDMHYKINIVNSRIRKTIKLFKVILFTAISVSILAFIMLYNLLRLITIMIIITSLPESRQMRCTS